MLVKHIYETTHLANPVAEFEVMKWKDLIFADDLILEGSYVCLDASQNIVAYSFLHESDSENCFELGWCGSATDADLGAIPKLVWKQIEYAIEKGYHYVSGEFDSTSIYAMEALREIPFPTSVPWLTYQKTEKE